MIEEKLTLLNSASFEIFNWAKNPFILKKKDQIWFILITGYRKGGSCLMHFFFFFNKISKKRLFDRFTYYPPFS